MAELKTDDFEPELDPDEIDADEKIKQIFEDIGEDITSVKCKLYRIMHGEFEWLYDAAPPEMPGVHDRLRDEYGPGLYETRIFANGRMRKRLKIKIGGKLSDKFPQIVDNSMKPDQVLGMIKEMQETQMAQFKLMMESNQNNLLHTIQAQAQNMPEAAPPVDPLTMQASMLTMMSQMKDFLTPVQPSSVQDPIELMTKMLELQQTLSAASGEAGTVPMLASVAKEVLPQLVDLAKIEGLKKSPAANTPPIPTPPQGLMERAQAQVNPKQGATLQNNPQPAPMPETPPENDEMMQNMFIKQTIQILLPKAMQNRDPSVYAEVLLDTAAEYNQEEFAVRFIVQPGFVDALVKINPQIHSYRVWFEGLRQAVIEMTEEQPATTQQEIDLESVNTSDQESVISAPGRGNGDTRDTQDNVPFSQTVQEKHSDS